MILFSTITMNIWCYWIRHGSYYAKKYNIPVEILKFSILKNETLEKKWILFEFSLLRWAKKKDVSCKFRIIVKVTRETHSSATSKLDLKD